MRLLRVLVLFALSMAVLQTRGEAAQADHATATPAPLVIQNSVQVAPDPYDMLIDPATGHVFVTADAADRVSVLDARTGMLLTTINVGYQPTLMALDVRTEHLVVLNSNADIHPHGKSRYGSISIIDVTHNRVIHTRPLHWNPCAVAIDAGSGRAFVVGNTRTMLVLDTVTGAVVRTVQLPAGLGLEATSGSMRFDPRMHHVFIRGEIDSLNGFIDGMVVTVDSPSGAVLRAQTLHADLTDMALDSAGVRLYVSGTITPFPAQPDPRALAGTVNILDTATGRLLGTLRHVGHAADAIAYDAGNAHLFVEDQRAGTITMIDGSSGKQLRTISTLTGASVLAVYGARHQLLVTFGRPETANISQVDVLDTRTGALVQTMLLDPTTYTFPQVLAVDGASRHVLIAYRSDAVLTLADGVAPQPRLDQPAANAADAANLRLTDMPAGATLLDHHTGAGAHVADVLSSPGQTGTLLPTSGAKAASVAVFTVTPGLSGTSVLSLVVSFQTTAQAHTAYRTARAEFTSAGTIHDTERWPISTLGQERMALAGPSQAAHGDPVTDSLVLFRQDAYVVVVGIFNASTAYPGEQVVRLAALVDARIRHASRPAS